jgi:hypothetical protein
LLIRLGCSRVCLRGETLHLDFGVVVRCSAHLLRILLCVGSSVRRGLLVARRGRCLDCWIYRLSVKT